MKMTTKGKISQEVKNNLWLNSNAVFYSDTQEDAISLISKNKLYVVD